ncbi:ubiquinol-cytochrome c reductase complex assembly factor 6 isoform 1-T1 [Megaptera novaeangliae]
MPAGVSWTSYLKMFAASLLAMCAGAEVVHRYYRPDLTIPEIPPKPGELKTELLGLKERQHEPQNSSLPRTLKRKTPCKDRRTGRMPGDNRGKDWSDAATSQGTPPEARKRQGRILAIVCEHGSADTWISDFWPLELVLEQNSLWVLLK